MPQWEGIEDASAEASRVWFYRAKDSDEWKPLRKVDCQALNHANDNQETVYIDGGRLVAHLHEGVIRHNFLQVEYQLCSAIWFRRDEKSKEVQLVPIRDKAASDVIEAFYQKVVAACSSLGEGLASVSNESVTLPDEPRIILNKSPLKLIWKEKGWFAAQYDLQRGYGEYKVEGEEEELLLGPVSHVAFVIHGIGEALFSREHISVPSIVDQMTATRISIQKRQAAEYKAACLKAKQKGADLPAPPSRLEIIPIEWFHRVHDSSSMLMKSLQLTTLTTIPALRAIANDVIFDVLMYLTPKFCQAVLECVTEQICTHYQTFLRVHEGFQGKCSLIGHSLGSVITWDLLSVLQQHQQQQAGTTGPSKHRPVSIPSQDSVEIGYQAYATDQPNDASSHAMAEHGTWGPSLTRPMQQIIPFVPECTIFLGSPIGLFLTLRGAHAVFDSLRQDEIAKLRHTASSGGTDGGALDQDLLQDRIASPFSLPTNYLYNIFHPSDPVAYRIEPLLLSPDLNPEDLPPPVYLTAIGKDVRLHVKARQLADEFSKSLKDQKNSWNALIDSTLTVLSTTSAAAAQVEAASPRRLPAHGSAPGAESPPWPPVFPLGSPMQAKRVDYTFQPAIVENEYLNAVLAHSSYFSNVDFQDFLITRFIKTEAPGS